MEQLPRRFDTAHIALAEARAHRRYCTADAHCIIGREVACVFLEAVTAVCVLVVH
jgi:hypothetical protein